MSDENAVLKHWEELKTIVEVLEQDVLKSSKGVAAAGVRMRKGLRQLGNKTKELVKLSVQLDKERTESKKSSS